MGETFLPMPAPARSWNLCTMYRLNRCRKIADTGPESDVLLLTTVHLRSRGYRDDR